jgi:hypothetical protein
MNVFSSLFQQFSSVFNFSSIQSIFSGYGFYFLLGIFLLIFSTIFGVFFRPLLVIFGSTTNIIATLYASAAQVVQSAVIAFMAPFRSLMLSYPLMTGTFLWTVLLFLFYPFVSKYILIFYKNYLYDFCLIFFIVLAVQLFLRYNKQIVYYCKRGVYRIYYKFPIPHKFLPYKFLIFWLAFIVIIIMTCYCLFWIQISYLSPSTVFGIKHTFETF